MVTNKPDDIEERLEPHETDLNAIKISSQAATAFAARSNPAKRSLPNIPPPTTIPSFNRPTNLPVKDNTLKPFYHCNNCGCSGHSVMQCFAPGGSLARQEPQGKKNINNQVRPTPIPYQNYPRGVLLCISASIDPKNNQNKSNVPQPAKQEKNIAMMAPEENNIKISSNPSILPNICDKKCLWLNNLGAFDMSSSTVFSRWGMNN